MHYIYIMTNPAYEGYVKIGSTDTTVEQRRKELSNPPGVMFPFEIYAYYETSNSIDDKKLHRMIDTINPNLRANKRREFYKMTPEEAFLLLEGIAEISGTKEKLILVAENSTIQETKRITRKAKFSFEKAGIPKRSKLTYIEDESINPIYAGDDKAKNIEYNGERYSLSSLAQVLLGTESQVQGTLFFKYEGETLSDRRNRMEEEGTYR